MNYPSDACSCVSMQWFGVDVHVDSVQLCLIILASRSMGRMLTAYRDSRVIMQIYLRDPAAPSILHSEFGDTSTLCPRLLSMRSS